MLTNPGSHYINDDNLFKCKHCSWIEERYIFMNNIVKKFLLSKLLLDTI